MRIRHRDDLDELNRAAKLLATMAAWSATGCFDALKQGPRALSELPGDPRALALTTPLLAHAGLLVQDGDHVGLSPEGHRVMGMGFGGVPTLDFLGDLSRLGDVLRSGGPVKDAQGKSRRTDGGIRRDNPEATRRFLDVLHEMSGEAAELTADAVARHVPVGARVLDLGGGHGRYGRTLADRGYAVTLFDIPAVVPLARERHGEALGYLGGDFLSDDLGGPWDVVLVSNVAHGLSDLENQALLRRLHAVVSPGGWVVIKDMFVDDLGSGPVDAVQFNLTMLCYTDAGQCWRLDEYTRWCVEAGFRSWHVVVGPSQTLVFAHA